jgi:hypothetical protein
MRDLDFSSITDFLALYSFSTGLWLQKSFTDCEAR